jgi:Mn2+/Fe2+ NRAMP family transporter
MLLVSILTLGAEIGGVAAALKLATGIPLPVWALPVAIVAWLILWRATFGFIENGVSLLGLVTLAFAVAVYKLHPSYAALARGTVPSLPSHDRAHYWFVAVSVLGASISPYLYYFYSSGAVEEEWDESYVLVNRFIAAIGMGFGGFLSIAVLVLAALLFHPGHIELQHYEQLPELLTPAFGRAGFWLFVASLGIACIGATLEISLSLAYLVAQGFGWKWGEDLPPDEDARFSLTYTSIVLVASLFSLVGLDPMMLTNIAMSLTSASLPIGVFPFLILMNDKSYLGERTNGWLSNGVVLVVSLIAAVLAVVSIPLEIIGGG